MTLKNTTTYNKNIELNAYIHSTWIMDKKYPLKKKGTSGTQNVLGWEIFYYCSRHKFSVFHSNWQHDSAHRHSPVQQPPTPNGSMSLWNIGYHMP
jgi:hypothetical protein